MQVSNPLLFDLRVFTFDSVKAKNCRVQYSLVEILNFKTSECNCIKKDLQERN